MGGLPPLARSSSLLQRGVTNFPASNGHTLRAESAPAEQTGTCTDSLPLGAIANTGERPYSALGTEALAWPRGLSRGSRCGGTAGSAASLDIPKENELLLARRPATALESYVWANRSSSNAMLWGAELMEDKAGVKAPPAGGPGRHPGRLCATAGSKRLHSKPDILARPCNQVQRRSSTPGTRPDMLLSRGGTPANQPDGGLVSRCGSPGVASPPRRRSGRPRTSWRNRPVSSSLPASWQDLVEASKQALDTSKSAAPTGCGAASRSWEESMFRGVLSIEVLREHHQLGEEEIQRLYRTLRVYTLGFHQMVSETSAHAFDRAGLMMSIWRAFSQLWDASLKVVFESEVLDMVVERDSIINSFAVTQDQLADARDENRALKQKLNEMVQGAICRLAQERHLSERAAELEAHIVQLMKKRRHAAAGTPTAPGTPGTPSTPSAAWPRMTSLGHLVQDSLVEDDEELEMLRGELQRTQAQLKQAQQQASLGSSELDHLQGNVNEKQSLLREACRRALNAETKMRAAHSALGGAKECAAAAEARACQAVKDADHWKAVGLSQRRAYDLMHADWIARGFDVEAARTQRAKFDECLQETQDLMKEREELRLRVKEAEGKIGEVEQHLSQQERRKGDLVKAYWPIMAKVKGAEQEVEAQRRKKRAYKEQLVQLQADILMLGLPLPTPRQAAADGTQTSQASTPGRCTDASGVHTDAPPSTVDGRCAPSTAPAAANGSQAGIATSSSEPDHPIPHAATLPASMLQLQHDSLQGSQPQAHSRGHPSIAARQAGSATASLMDLEGYADAAAELMDRLAQASSSSTRRQSEEEPASASRRTSRGSSTDSTPRSSSSHRAGSRRSLDDAEDNKRQSGQHRPAAANSSGREHSDTRTTTHQQSSARHHGQPSGGTDQNSGPRLHSNDRELSRQSVSSTSQPVETSARAAQSTDEAPGAPAAVRSSSPATNARQTQQMRRLERLLAEAEREAHQWQAAAAAAEERTAALDVERSALEGRVDALQHSRQDAEARIAQLEQRLQGMAAQSLANMDAYEETRAQLELLRHPSAAGKAVPGK